MPIAMPAIMPSASGVSITRSGPNRSSEPERRAENAAVPADVLPEHDDVVVALHLASRARG